MSDTRKRYTNQSTFATFSLDPDRGSDPRAAPGSAEVCLEDLQYWSESGKMLVPAETPRNFGTREGRGASVSESCGAKLRVTDSY